jgi:broad specificity phosphatase PhoE
MARLIAVRHGNTFDPGDTVLRAGARTDLALSVSGREQAGALAAHFAGTTFLAAACSPLLRTRQTARAILAARTDAPALIILPFLTEIDYGPDEGRPETEVVARLGEAALAAWDRDAILPPGWQADPDALRAGWSQLLARVARLPEDSAVLVVTSNGIARFLIDAADAVAQATVRKLRTGAYGEVACSRAGSRITGWNLRP